MLLEGEGGETGPRPASETPKPLCLTQQGGGGHPCTAQLSLEGGSLRQASGGGPLPGTHPHWEMRSGYELWLGGGRQRWCSSPGVKHTFTHTLTCLPTRHMLIHTRTFTGVSTHAHTITHTCARTGTCSHMDIHTCTRGCTAPQAHTDNTHARTEEAVRFCSGSSSGGGPRPPGRAAGVQGPGDAVCGDVPTCPLKSPCQNRSPPTTQATEVRAAGSNTHPQSPLLSSLPWGHVALLGFCVWGPEGLLL